jgi:hypothetical protein
MKMKNVTAKMSAGKNLQLVRKVLPFGAVASLLTATFLISACGAEKKTRSFAPDPTPTTVFAPPPIPAPIVAGTATVLQGKVHEGRFSLKSVECVVGQPTGMARSEMELLSANGRNYAMNPFHTGTVDNSSMSIYNVRRNYEWTIQGSEGVKIIKTVVNIGGQSSTMSISKRYSVSIKPTGQLVLLHGSYDTATYEGFNFDPLYQLIQKEFVETTNVNDNMRPSGFWGHLKNFIAEFLKLNKYAVNLFQEVAGVNSRQ